MQTQRQETKKITIMGLLADCSTSDARKLLKKYGITDAKNKHDLELKLAQLYKTCDDKKQLEKDFAEIHPHKDFLKKYLVPKIQEEIKAETVIESPTPIESIVVGESKSNYTGNGCSCGSIFSGVDGSTNTNTKNDEKDRLIIYGMFGVFSILALVLISKQKLLQS